MKKSILFITICILTNSNLFAQIDWKPYVGKVIIATYRKLLGVIYDTLKNDCVFDDFANGVIV